MNGRVPNQKDIEHFLWGGTPSASYISIRKAYQETPRQCSVPRRKEDQLFFGPGLDAFIYT